MFKKNGGFTKIEGLMIFLILAILAAVMIPKYVDITSEFREKSARAALGSLRVRINHQARLTGTASWPTLVELEELDIPRNPYQTNSDPSAIAVAGVTKGELVESAVGAGWVYDSETGKIWLNTNTHGENNW